MLHSPVVSHVSIVEVMNDFIKMAQHAIQSVKLSLYYDKLNTKQWFKNIFFSCSKALRELVNAYQNNYTFFVISWR